MKQERPPITPLALYFRNAFIIFIFLAIAALFTVWFIGSCRVKTVLVENEVLIPEPAVLDAIEVKAGTHLYAINEEKIEEKLTAASPYVRSVTLKRRLPSELQIFVEEYTLSYYIIYAEKYYLLTDELLVLEETTPEKASALGAIPITLPKLKDPKATKENPDPPKVLTLGKTLTFDKTSDLKWTKKLLSAIEKTDFADEITEIDLSDPFSLKLYLGKKYKILLGNERGLEKKLNRTENALSYLKESMYALTGVIHAEQDAPVTFTFDGVIKPETT